VSTPKSSPLSLDLDQQRKRAKDLIRAARAGDQDAIARILAVRPDAGSASRSLALADAQLAVAREAGFASWPALVADAHGRDVKAFAKAVEAKDEARVRQLVSRPHVRAHVNDPMFAFGQRAAHMAATNEQMLETLMAAGADVTLKSDWANGPYTVLDRADDGTARWLISRDVSLTPNAAARLGWFDDLKALVSADKALVHARGGDGQQPLHEAKTVAIADFLLDHGADIDARCIDHKSTPAQYALVDRPDVCNRLIDRGATPDIFMAARLGDRALAARLIDQDPTVLGARVNAPGYALVPPFNIYCWTLGFGRSPMDVASNFGHGEVRELFVTGASPRIRLLDALQAADERKVQAVIEEHPSLLSSLTREDHSRLAIAIFHEQFDGADLMIRYGFDPAAPGVDGGTALHAACWVGAVRLVNQLIAAGGVQVDARDPTHGGTPLGWTAFGSVHRCARGGDYPAVAERLVAAGADITAVGNGAGLSLLEMAHGNPTMQAALRKLGA
jgi:ankyrin repeat protein